jgi:hypothetical protein
MIQRVSTCRTSSRTLLTITDARAVFETVVGKITSKPENIARAKSLFLFFHDYESQFGELAQITKLEQRMLTLYPEDPQLQRFSQRFAGPTFDPTVVRPIISPRAQMRPVMPSMPSIMNSVEEQHPVMPPQIEQRFASPPVQKSPHLTNLMPAMNTNSPKRPLEDDDSNQPRKLARCGTRRITRPQRCSRPPSRRRAPQPRAFRQHTRRRRPHTSPPRNQLPPQHHPTRTHVPRDPLQGRSHGRNDPQ